MSQQLTLHVFDTPAATLDNFIMGANAEALNAIRHCAPGRAVYLWGPPGSGRTHLLKAASARAGGVYVGPTEASQRLPALAEADPIGHTLIAIDDVGLLGDREQAALFRLYNRWREQGDSPEAFALVLAADRAPLTLPLREDLRTRLGWDLIFRLELLSDEQRTQALQALAAERGMTLSPEVVNWLLTHYTRNMSTLSALVAALDRYSLEQQRAITLPLLKDLLSRADTPS